MTSLKYLRHRSHTGHRRRAGALEGIDEPSQLHLGGTQVTDAGLAHLNGLTKLYYLDLDGTKVSDRRTGASEGADQLSPGSASTALRLAIRGCSI